MLMFGFRPSMIIIEKNKEFSERKELIEDQVKLRTKLNVTDSIQRGTIDLS